VLSYLPDVADASRTSESPDAGTPAGTVVVRAADLRVQGERIVAAGNAALSAGELAVFFRPVVTAPAVVRRDGTVRACAWLPDLVRLGELERHLGDGVIEAVVAAALEKGRLKRRQRRRIMSYPLVIRLMLAMTLMPEASYCEPLARLAGRTTPGPPQSRALQAGRKSSWPASSATAGPVTPPTNGPQSKQIVNASVKYERYAPAT
jgi:hypothetical protein